MREIPGVLVVGESAEVEFDESVYSLDTVQRAALKFSDMASIAIKRPEPGLLRASIALFADSATRAEDLGRVLVNEVLDQALRARIADETAVERTLILSHVFSRSKIANAE